MVIVLEEAEIVRLIFRHYLEGYSAKMISQYLEENGIKTATGQDKWYDSVIFKMLRNEKYMGNALLQKTYTVEQSQMNETVTKVRLALLYKSSVAGHFPYIFHSEAF